MDPKITIIPEHFFTPGRERELLGDICILTPEEEVKTVAIGSLGVVMLYVPQGEALPELYKLLCSIKECEEYNRILCNYTGGILSLVIAQGMNLLLANVYKAVDFTTAEYFIFSAMKNLQLNPEMSTVRFSSHISKDEELSLYRYFESVDKI